MTTTTTISTAPPTKAIADHGLSAADIIALTRSLDRILAKPGRAEQIAWKLEHDGWFETATFAAYSEQMDSMPELHPGAYPPCWIDDPDDPDLLKDAECRMIVKLLKRMLAKGISRYDPDPRAALQRCKARP